MKKHISSTNQAPYGEIAILTPYGGPNRVKKYNGKDVFLDNGTEFAIELDNPTSFKYLVKIKINGEYISSSGLVLRPGEHAYLERYIDDDRKFRFETYIISSDRKDLIEKNGLVEIEFYKESIPLTTWSWSYGYDPWPYVPSVKPWPPAKPWPDSTWITYTSHTSNDVVYSVKESNVNLNYCNFKESLTSESPQVETGRIEQGQHSEQKFQNTYGSFDSCYSYRSEFKIWPTSQKQAVVQQDIRSYCSGCGRRKRQGENFCPKCGQRL